jgi:DnaJ-class molecular chaperone
MNKVIECPECGTEVEPDYCPDCDGKGVVGSLSVVVPLQNCSGCKGTGVSNDYHCSHCSWQKEE